jgi:hypothetical protein
LPQAAKLEAQEEIALAISGNETQTDHFTSEESQVRFSVFFL